MKSSDLGGPLLASVSRSFYLSIRLLPREIRAPIGLAYLLARASDTIADTAEASVEARLNHLSALEKMIRTGRVAGLAELQSEIRAPDPKENALIASLDRCLEWLATLESKDHGEISAVLQKIIHGQTLDLERFGEGSRVVALQSAEELEEYTYLVAGCVGEFWTRVCLQHFPDCSHLGLVELRQLGANFGKGLQLVNILRDLPADLQQGRCYLPENELRAAGTSPAPLAHEPSKAQPVFDQLACEGGRVSGGRLSLRAGASFPKTPRGVFSPLVSGGADAPVDEEEVAAEQRAEGESLPFHGAFRARDGGAVAFSDRALKWARRGTNDEIRMTNDELALKDALRGDGKRQKAWALRARSGSRGGWRAPPRHGKSARAKRPKKVVRRRGAIRRWCACGRSGTHGAAERAIHQSAPAAEAGVMARRSAPSAGKCASARSGRHGRRRAAQGSDPARACNCECHDAADSRHEPEWRACGGRVAWRGGARHPPERALNGRAYRRRERQKACALAPRSGSAGGWRAPPRHGKTARAQRPKMVAAVERSNPPVSCACGGAGRMARRSAPSTELALKDALQGKREAAEGMCASRAKRKPWWMARSAAPWEKRPAQARL